MFKLLQDWLINQLKDVFKSKLLKLIILFLIEV